MTRHRVVRSIKKNVGISPIKRPINYPDPAFLDSIALIASVQASNSAFDQEQGGSLKSTVSSLNLTSPYSSIGASRGLSALDFAYVTFEER